MKLPTLRQSTQAKLETAIAARATAEQRLVTLDEERRALLASDGDIEGLPALQAAVAQQRAVIGGLGERIVLLEERKRREDDEQRQREHWAAVEKFEATLPNRLNAAVRVEEAIAALAVAVRDFETVNEVCRKAWPPGVVAWGAYHLDGDRVGGLLAEAFSPGGLVRRRGSQIIGAPAHIEYAERASSADQRSAGFVDQERLHHEELIADLRAQGVPEPEAPPEPDEEPAEENLAEQREVA